MAMSRPGSPYGDNGDNGTIYTIDTYGDSGDSMVMHWRSIGEPWWQWLLWWQLCQWITNVDNGYLIVNWWSIGTTGVIGDSGAKGLQMIPMKTRAEMVPMLLILTMTQALIIVVIGAMVANGTLSFWWRSWPWIRHLMAPLVPLKWCQWLPMAIANGAKDDSHWRK